MRNEFTLHFAEGMPKGTAQQKRYDGRNKRYFKSKSLVIAERTFFAALYPHRPKKPSEHPIRLTLKFYFDVKDKKKWGHPKTTVPDVENYAKAFIDQMTRTGFWEDDAQVYDLHLTKHWVEEASIEVEWEEVEP